MLYIVATPIGNLDDITFRAIQTLKSVDYIAAEDTRHSGILMKKYDIKTPLISFHSFSGRGKIEHIIELMKNGKNVALISDAGTPGISDPGYVLIKAAIHENIEVSPIPGVSAFLAALSVSGMATHEFFYLGFLPKKKGRKTLLESLKNEKRTVVFYESPHRLIRTLEDLIEYFGSDKTVIIARELTKIHEEIFRGTVQEAFEYFSRKSIKGEFVIML